MAVIAGNLGLFIFTGDGKSAPNPLFRVKVVLEGDKVEFSPTLKQLALIVGSIGSHLTESISCIRRLPDILISKKRSHKEVSNLVQLGIQAAETPL